MPIIVCGLNHKTAPIELREQVTFAPEKIACYLADLQTQENINEAVLLSTCNRSELYCVAEDSEKVIDWFCNQHLISREDIVPFLYCYHDQVAIEHIMNVACGLDSMVLGETEIIRQMKDAFAESCAASAVGTLFNRLFQEVFSVSKQIRTTTAIGACPVSVSSAAVSFIKEYYPASFTEANILVMGAGMAAELIMRYLQLHSPKQILIANRSKEKAELLAQQYECETVELADLPSALIDADIVISATGSPTPIILSSMIESRKKPLFIVDIAVPRDVEPSVADCALVSLYSIDDLRPIIQKNLQGREHAADKAREMIAKKSQDFMMWLNSLEKVATTIRAYRRQVEELCCVELAKAKKQLQRGEDPVVVLANFSHALSNKLLHTPTVQLRQAGHEGRFELLQLAQELFAISELEPELT